MEGAPHNFQLLEAPSPDALVPSSPVETWMIVAVVGALVAIALLVFWIFGKRRTAAADPAVARNVAYQEAVAALDEISPTASTRDAAVRSSLITRKYLSTAAGDPALFETHEEYVSRHEALKNFTAEARSAAESGFTRLAALKYSAEVPEVAASHVVSESRNLLETLHSGFRA